MYHREEDLLVFGARGDGEKEMLGPTGDEAEGDGRWTDRAFYELRSHWNHRPWWRASPIWAGVTHARLRRRRGARAPAVQPDPRAQRKPMLL